MMTKKLLSVILLLTVAIVCLFGCTASKKEDPDNADDKHVHDYVTTIVEPTCAEKGYTTYTCSCGNSYDSDYVNATGMHDYVDGFCQYCGAQKPSSGLSYTINADNESYTLTGIGTCTDTDVIIAADVNGYAVTSIGRAAFSGCISLTSIIIPDGVTSIGYRAFGWCNGLTSITIGKGVTSIGKNAFDNCYKLIEVINKSNLDITKGSSDDSRVAEYALNVKTEGTSDIAKVNDYWFYTYDNVNYFINYGGNDTGLVLPDNYNGQNYEIYEYAFYNRVNLTSVTIPNGVTSIDFFAFYGCRNLTTITIPSSVTSIGNEAFEHCYKLVEVINKSNLNITKGSKDNGYVANYALNVKTEGTSDIINVNDYLFYTYNNVNYLLGYLGNDTELVLPDNYNGQNYKIYWFAFYNRDKLTSITIDSGVTSIGVDAFCSCSSLKSITLGDCVTNIDVLAFHNCISLTSVSIPDSVTSISVGAFFYCISLTSVSIPDSVTSISDEAFYCCRGLNSITIPNSVTSIGEDAFYDCSNLKYNEYDNAYYLGNDNNPYLVLVKAKSTSITSCTINENTKVIADSAFNGCGSLTSVTIGNGVTSIGYRAFYNCSSLISITIPDSVTSIGFSAFYNCSGLTSIAISDSVTSIGFSAFYNCGSLTSITIPDSVTSIGSDTFSGCSSLTIITIPDSVTSIGYWAFRYCTSLKKVYFIGTAEEWAKVEIGKDNDSLKSATVYYYSDEAPTAEGNYWHYDDNGNVVEW